jgi:hypothetical protein
MVPPSWRGAGVPPQQLPETAGHAWHPRCLGTVVLTAWIRVPHRPAMPPPSGVREHGLITPPPRALARCVRRDLILVVGRAVPAAAIR